MVSFLPVQNRHGNMGGRWSTCIFLRVWWGCVSSHGILEVESAWLPWSRLVSRMCMFVELITSIWGGKGPPLPHQVSSPKILTALLLFWSPLILERPSAATMARYLLISGSFASLSPAVRISSRPLSVPAITLASVTVKRSQSGLMHPWCTRSLICSHSWHQTPR